MEPVLHFAIPFTVAILITRKVKYAMLTGFLGTLPDLDVFLLLHRSASHSIIPAIALAFISLLIRRKILRSILLFSTLGWGSHSMLDLIGGDTPILWPVSERTYNLILESRFQILSFPTLSFRFEVLDKPYDYGIFTNINVAVFTAEGLVLALLLVIAALVMPGSRKKAF